MCAGTFKVQWRRPSSGGSLYIKMSYQYRDPHVKKQPRDRLIFNMGILIPGEDGIHIETGPGSVPDRHSIM